jgi:hypothetical protein
MRRLAALCVCLPVALGGMLLAHQAGYLAAHGHDGATAELAHTGHGYLSQAPLAAAILGVLVVVGLASEGMRGRRGGGPPALSAVPFAALAPIAFLVQEHLERALHDGSIPWSTILEPAVLLGLVVQVPVALLSFRLARRLLLVARRIAEVVGRDAFVRVPGAGARRVPRRPVRGSRPAGPALLSVGVGRAPPRPLIG